MQSCPRCGSNDLVYSGVRGDTVCAQCAEVVEEHGLVAEVGFVASGGGQKFLAGVDMKNSSAGMALRGPNRIFSGQLASSWEGSLQRGLAKLNVIAERMQLSIGIQEAGRRMFQLAAQMNFTLGRPGRLVAVACLYVICRRNKSPHLMIDFSDEIRVPVVNIGRTYIRLMRRLIGGDPRNPVCVTDPTVAEIPLIDPSFFVERYARRLDCGFNQRALQKTAVKLIQFMHRDWICLGRRPNGLCGAALLIASFYHGLKYTAKDISSIVRMGEDTLRQRLLELRQTPLALMNRKEFELADPKSVVEGVPRPLPPCMVKSMGQHSRFHAIEDSSYSLPALQDGSSKGASDAIVAERSTVVEVCTKESVDACADKAAMPPPRTPPKKKPRLSKEVVDPDAERNNRFTSQEPSCGDIQRVAHDIVEHLDIEGIMSANSGSSSSFADASARIDGIVERKSASIAVTERSVTKSDGEQNLDMASDEEETLSELDEEELDLYLLDEAERRDKAAVWLEINRDYLEEWHVRSRENQKKKERAAASEVGSETASNAGSLGSGRSSGRSSRRRWRPQTGSCVESTALALQKKGKVPASLINMEALQSLFDD